MSGYFMANRKRLAMAVAAVLCCGTAGADFPAQFELSSLNGANGVTFNGINAADLTGDTVSSAGDINDDGIDDLVIGAPFADPNGSFSGACYVVFGKSQGFSSPLELSTLNGSNGFVINGEAVFDGACEAVSAAGDVNGDGKDDLVIGAPDASPGVDFAGSTYVVFGTDGGFSSPLELSGLDGSDGFVINGVGENDASGTSVAGAGDVNGDGIDDIVIGAPFAPAGSGAGMGYVVFGKNTAWAAALDLKDLDGNNGFTISGLASGDSFGASVGGAGDVNADGIDDLILGAPLAGPVGTNPGFAYVVFGKNTAWAADLTLNDLDGSNGFAVSGVAAGDGLGSSVRAAGDINGDDIDDLLLGAPEADPNGSASGASYVVFGSDQVWPGSVALSGLDGTNGFAMYGVSAGDGAGSFVGSAGKLNADTIDDLVIGAPFADPNGSASGSAYVVFGSNQAWSGSLNLSVLNGSNGFTLRGVAVDDRAGSAVGTAGDFDNDGKWDLLIGAPGDPLGASLGFAYLVFGDSGAVGDVIFADGFE